MRILCTICARGGSKGVPNKNLRPLLGKPLVGHSVERARASGFFDSIAVSSDSDEILAAARDAGADQLVRRPSEMATDTAAKLPVIRHCARTVEDETGKVFDLFVDLDVTSPLRSIEDIAGAVALLQQSGAENVITAMPARRSPYFNLVELNADGIAVLSKPPSTTVTSRQASPPCFDMNASIYVWRRDALLNGPDTIFLPTTRLFVMPEERSIDIDSELDFAFVEFLTQQQRRGGS